MAVTPTGSVLTVAAVGDSGATSIAVPADADAVVIGVGGYWTGGLDPATKLDGAVITIGGVQIGWRVGAQSAPGGDLAGAYAGVGFPTGTQTLSWNWEGTGSWAEGGTLIIRFYKGVDQDDPVRDALGAGTQAASSPQTATTGLLSAVSGDYIAVVAGAWSSTIGSFTWAGGITEQLDATFNGFRQGFAEVAPLFSRSVSATYTAGGSGDRTIAVAAVVLRAAQPPIPDNTVTLADAFPTIGHQYQRGSFTAAGRDWVFYASNHGEATASIYCRSSADGGATWSAPTLIRSFVGPWYETRVLDFALKFDGTYLHYAMGGGEFAPAESTLLYRRGLPNSDGTITWSAAEQEVWTDEGALIEIDVAVDSNGVPFVSWEQNKQFNGDTTPFVSKATSADGTWTTAPGHPVQLNDRHTHWWTGIAKLDNSGRMIVFYWHDDFGGIDTDYSIFARVWDGAAWGEEMGVDDPRRSDLDWSGINTIPCFVTDPDEGMAYYVYRDLNWGLTYCWVYDHSLGYGVVEVVGDESGTTFAIGQGGSKDLWLVAIDNSENFEVTIRKRDHLLGAWTIPSTLPASSGFPIDQELQISERGDRLLVLFTRDYDSGRTALIWDEVVDPGSGEEPEPEAVPLQVAQAVASGSLALRAPTRVALAAASAAASASLSLRAPALVPLASASAAATAALALRASTAVPLQGAAAAAAGELTLVAEQVVEEAPVPLQAAAAAVSAALELRAPTAVSLGSATAVASGSLALHVPVLLGLAPAPAVASASLQLRAPALVPLASATAVAVGSLQLRAPTLVPLASADAVAGGALTLATATVPTLALQAAEAAASATLALRAPTLLSLSPAAAAASGALVLRAIPRLPLDPAAASATGALALHAPTALVLGPAVAVAEGALSLGALDVAVLPLQAAAAELSTSLAVRAETQVPLSGAQAAAAGSLALTSGSGLGLGVAAAVSGAQLALRAPALLALAPADAVSSAEATLRAPTTLVLAPAAAVAEGQMALGAAGQLPMAPAVAVSDASMALRATVLLELTAEGVAGGTLVLSRVEPVSLDPAQAQLLTFMSLGAEALVQLSPAEAVLATGLLLRAPALVPLAAAAAAADAELALRAVPLFQLLAQAQAGATMGMRVITQLPLGQAQAQAGGTLVLYTTGMVPLDGVSAALVTALQLGALGPGFGRVRGYRVAGRLWATRVKH